MKTNPLSGQTAPPLMESGGKHSHSTLLKTAAAVLLLLLSAAVFCGAAAAVTITFEPGDGSGTSYTQTVEGGVDTPLTLMSGFTAPEGEEKFFLKWLDGDGKKYGDGQMINLTKDTTLTAQWIKPTDVVKGPDLERMILQDDGYYRLKNHLESFTAGLSVLSGRIAVLDLNGFALKLPEEKYISIYNSESDPGYLKIVDSNPAASNSYINPRDPDRKETLQISGGLITGSTMTGCVYNTGTLVLTGGNIAGNLSKLGDFCAGVNNGGVFIMSGGCITENFAMGAGAGGVYTVGPGAVFIMSGGSIIGNDKGESRYLAGGVYVGPKAKFFVSGSAVIKDNTFGRDLWPSNITISDAELFHLAGPFTGDIRISDVPGVIIEAGQQFGLAAEGVTTEDAKHIRSDVNSLFGTVKDGKLVWATVNKLIRYNEKIFDIDTIIGGQGSPFNAENAIYNYNENTLTLKEDVTLEGTLEIIAPKSSTPFTIDLGEKTLTGNGSASVITVVQNAELTITDTSCASSTSSGNITKGGSSGILVGGKLTLNNGHITGNKAAANGGGVYVSNGGLFTINNGFIYSNTAENGNGGGVYICNGGTFEMKDGGSIYGNTANNGNGGGVYVEEKGTFKITSSGALYYNTAKNGAGVYNTGTFTMNGGSIYNNNNFFLFPSNATENGGGVYNSGTFTMTSGSIFSNKAKSGAGVYNTGTFSVTSDMKANIPLSTISSNEAAIDGGGVFNSGTLSLSGFAKITSNKVGSNEAEGRGGGVYNIGTFKVSQAPAVKENTKTKDNSANNVYLDNNKLIEMTGDFSGEIYITCPAPESGNWNSTVPIATAANRWEGAQNFISDKPAEDGSVYTGVMDTQTTPFRVVWNDKAKRQYDVTIAEQSRNTESPEQNSAVNSVSEDKVLTSVSLAVEDAYVTAITVPGYRADSKSVEIKQKAPYEYYFTMPAHDVVVEPVPAPYHVTTKTEGKGRLTVSLTEAGAGDIITITAETASGSRLSSLTAKETVSGTPVAIDEENNTFTMPAADVTVTAVFTGGGSSSSGSSPQGSSVWLTEIPTPTVTPTPTPTPAPEVPSVKPVASETPAGKSPAPVMGVLAGLGAAAAVLAVRMRR